ncbi:hypothetical protein F2P56_024211 [Juglans regia]|nr:hypothetical protein F2P56_024211 [Juglans regia]
MDDRSVLPLGPLLLNFKPSELRIASKFLTTWLPFLSRDLCQDCFQTFSDRLRSLELEISTDAGHEFSDEDFDAPVSEKTESQLGMNDYYDETSDTYSVGSWIDGANGYFDYFVPEQFMSGPPSHDRMSWANMAKEEEDVLVEEDDEEDSEAMTKRVVGVNTSTGESRISMKAIAKPPKPKLLREQRERIRLMNVKRKQDFVWSEKLKGKIVNILEGLELHTGIFSAAEQKRIADYVYKLEEMGRKGELKERTFTAPTKGKGRVTIQFGCCYNDATDKKGNPAGILHDQTVDPMPHLFKEIIKRLIRWHVLPGTCIPDSCVVNIYEEGDCMPPHVDNRDFLRPICTVSFLSECDIIFGSNLKVLGPDNFEGSVSIPLPAGSALVLNGNGANMAKHCVPPVPTARISITFRRMDDSKRPIGYVAEPDLQDIQQLPYVVDRRYRLKNCPRPEHYSMMTWRGCSEERSTSRKPRSSSCQSCRRNSLSRSRGPPYRNRSRVR